MRKIVDQKLYNHIKKCIVLHDKVSLQVAASGVSPETVRKVKNSTSFVDYQLKSRQARMRRRSLITITGQPVKRSFFQRFRALFGMA